MTDSLQDAQSTVPFPVTLNNQPHWELGAEACTFPFLVESGGRSYEITVRLKQKYAADTLIGIFNSNPGSYKRDASGVEIFTEDDTKYGRLIDQLFVSIEGTSAQDTVQQKRWLDQNPRVKSRMARECLGGLEINSVLDDVPANEEERIDLLPLALDCSETSITGVQEVFDPSRGDRGAKVKIRMVHKLRPDTEADYRKWQRTGSQKSNKVNKTWSAFINWWERIHLYDAMVLSVQGMALNGEFCTESNKAAWLPLVPPWHKLAVINNAFDELRVKNG